MGARIGQWSPGLGESLVRGRHPLVRWDGGGPVTQPLAQYRPVDAVGMGQQWGETVVAGGLKHPGMPQRRQPGPQRLGEPALARGGEGGDPTVGAETVHGDQQRHHQIEQLPWVGDQVGWEAFAHPADTALAQGGVGTQRQGLLGGGEQDQGGGRERRGDRCRWCGAQPREIERTGQPAADFGRDEIVRRMAEGGGTIEQPAEQTEVFGDRLGATVGGDLAEGPHGTILLMTVIDAHAPRRVRRSWSACWSGGSSRS